MGAKVQMLDLTKTGMKGRGIHQQWNDCDLSLKAERPFLLDLSRNGGVATPKYENLVCLFQGRPYCFTPRLAGFNADDILKRIGLKNPYQANQGLNYGSVMS